MKQKSSTAGSRRRASIKSLLGLGRLREGLFVQLGALDLLAGVGMALFLTSLLVGYQFQTIPDYNVGDIADRSIEAPYDFTVQDREATFQKEREMIEKVPGVFDLDLKINARIESEVRSSFSRGRQLLADEKKRQDTAENRPLARSAGEKLLQVLVKELPSFSPEVVKIGLGHGFDPDLENQMVKLLQESLKYPGVILTRELLIPFQERGILLRNTVTAQDEYLQDWVAVRDLSQARSLLQNNRYELTSLREEERLQVISFLEGWIVPNLKFNETETGALEELATHEVDPVLIQVKKGKTIVRAGDDVKAKDLMLLEVLKQRKGPRRLAGQFFGIFILVNFFLLGLWHYFISHQKRHRKVRNHYLLFVLVLSVNLLLMKLFMTLSDLVAESLMTETFRNPLHFYYFAPFCVGVILIVLLIDMNLAILYSLILAVFVGLLTGDSSLFVYALTGSLAAIYALDQYQERSALIRAGLTIGLVNVIIALALQLHFSSSDLQGVIAGMRAAGGLSSGIFAAMLASLLLPILESWFQITTDIKLLELSNLNSPILRRLAVEAPGTYHHSIMVGTLAEAAAEAIEASPLLVRVGAYYHDIGKIKKPEYYVENQIYTQNKHESLSPSMSSLIIASHVKDGLALAEEINLVPRVRELIPQHHGTRLMTYFYQKAKDAAQEKNQDINENDFRYPGPKPQSKEAAILMLADQVEAAARTLQEPTPGQIRSVIQRLIQSTIQDGQFDECDVTMSELSKIAQAFERVLTSMHHHRIEYPGFDFGKEVGEERAEDQRIQ